MYTLYYTHPSMYSGGTREPTRVWPKRLGLATWVSKSIYIPYTPKYILRGYPGTYPSMSQPISTMFGTWVPNIPYYTHPNIELLIIVHISTVFCPPSLGIPAFFYANMILNKEVRYRLSKSISVIEIASIRFYFFADRYRMELDSPLIHIHHSFSFQSHLIYCQSRLYFEVHQINT
ncbi:unnamed protein product [Laminaria digitata]